VITSFVNERIKSIRKLQDRKAREESGLFFLEGLRVVAEAIDQGAELDTLVVSPDLLKSAFGQDLVARQRAQGTSLLEVSSDIFKRLSLKEGPQGLAAVARQHWTPLEQVTFRPRSGLASRTWVALDSVADPGNLGTILRTHDAVGGEGIILIDQSTDPYDPSAARASMGALFTQSLVKASLAQFRAWKQHTGIAVVGTSGAADSDYASFRYPDQMVLLMGSERQGLQEAHLALCDAIVSIPMVGASDSLNLAAATAVVLYEIFNQRRKQL
jgi:RNA methyltransferase, TrmH family